MLRRLLQLIAAVIAVAAVLTPLVEAFDCWDPFTMPANDTEMRAFCMVLGICFALAAVQFIARSLAAAFAGLPLAGMNPAGVLHLQALSGFAPHPSAAANSSPPPLRI